MRRGWPNRGSNGESNDQGIALLWIAEYWLVNGTTGHTIINMSFSDSNVSSFIISLLHTWPFIFQNKIIFYMQRMPPKGKVVFSMEQ